VARAIENHARRRFRIRLGARTLAVGPRPAIMGVLNVTPDSFSDGGRYLDPTDAVARAERLVQEGADLVDVGGESTRPGSDPVPEDEELARVMPVVETLASRLDVPISIDTRRARVAREAASAGAGLINDVTGLLGDPEMPAAVAETGAGCVIMHMLGEPKTMQHRPQYDNLMADIARHLRAAACRRPAMPASRRRRSSWTPASGSARRWRTTWRSWPAWANCGRSAFPSWWVPAASGSSARAAACTLAVAAGALLVRVHDVAEAVQALAVAAAVRDAAQQDR